MALSCHEPADRGTPRPASGKWGEREKRGKGGGGGRREERRRKGILTGGHRAEGAVHNVNAHRIRQATQTLLCTFLSPSTTWVMQTSACKTPKKIMKIKLKTKQNKKPKEWVGWEKKQQQKKKIQETPKLLGRESSKGKKQPP